jgi:hypothetical protein
VVRLDGRDLEPSPSGFLGALGAALDPPAGAPPLEALATRPRGVLLLDTYETLAPLDAWLREAFLPELPGGHVVVLAGRDLPAAAWLADPGWRELVRVVPLRNLRPEESRAYLGARGVPGAHHPAALAFTHGHPLALSLVADVLTAEGDPAPFDPEARPDVVRALLERFVEQLPSGRHRQALEVCAHVRVTTEALLAAALDADDAHDPVRLAAGALVRGAGPPGAVPPRPGPRGARRRPALAQPGELPRAASPASPCTWPARRTWRPTRPRRRPAASSTGTVPPGPARSWSTTASGWAPTPTRRSARPGTCWR